MVLDISSLTHGDIIIVHNKEELKTLLGALEDAGYLWANGLKPLDYRGYGHENVTAISIKYGKRITFWTTQGYLERIDKSFIHSFDDVIFSPPELDTDTPEPVIDLSGFFK